MKEHIWPLELSKAREVQEALGAKVRILPLRKQPRYVAALDAAFRGDIAVGAVCLFAYPGLELLEKETAFERCRFPYVPGYLTFREGPVLLSALGKLKLRPGLLLLDGQGIAHPRGLGIASHLGVLLGIPSVGCAKSRLTGSYREPGRKKGAMSVLRRTAKGKGKGPPGQTLGAVLRTRADVRPVFVSPGHLMDIDDSVRIVLACTGKYRVPEPLRCADLSARKAAKML
jgi:deoxyribonuclease V